MKVAESALQFQNRREREFELFISRKPSSFGRGIKSLPLVLVFISLFKAVRLQRERQKNECE